MKTQARIRLVVIFLMALTGLPAYSQAPLSNNMPASGVLGQPDFVSSSTGATASTTNNAFGVAIDPTTGKLFLADRNNNRVLRYGSADKMTNGPAAEAVLGQPDFVTVTANTGGISASTMNTPVRLFVDPSGTLWVSDYGNCRVLRFDNASSKSNGAAADGVLGQPDFVTGTLGTTATKMGRSTGIFVDDNGRLWVGDRDNNRVLRFDNAASKANGAAADGVLGQAGFTSGTSGLSASAMSGPFGVYEDNWGRLWVGEDGNCRVLRFDSAATKTNGAAADGVLGQPDFRTNTYSTQKNEIGNIRAIFGDRLGRLYVADEGNSRILIYLNAAAKPNGADADNVLGQPNFVSSVSPNPPNISSLAYPNSIFVDVDNNTIWVADAGNTRILRYSVLLTGAAANGVLGQSVFTTNSAGTTASTMNNAFGVAIDPTTGKLFVADRNNNRVLRFSSASAMIDGSAAEAVLGQPDFVTGTTNTGGLSASSMTHPVRVFVDPVGRLWVSDYDNHRILRFDGASSKANGAPANGVLGQPDFTTNTAGATASTMNRTTGVYVDSHGTLWVGERDNQRVLRFDSAATKANGASANGVLGEPDFTTISGGCTASLMGGVYGVYVDASGRLWVAEDDNNRLLRFDNAATKANGATADGVLGQPDFTTNAYNTTQAQTGNLRGVFGDNLGRIYVADEGNSRILIYSNAAMKTNGGNADAVLGQPDFVTGTSASPPTAGSFSYANSLFIDNSNSHLWVADAGNSRVLRFDLNLDYVGIGTVKVFALGSVKVGEYKDSTFTITNAGIDTLRIASITPSQPVFTVRPGSMNLGPGQSFTDTIRFTPAGTGTVNASLLIVSNAMTSPDSISVSATGVPAVSVASSKDLPSIYALYQNYPNPFNPSTMVKFSLPKASDVTLEVYDVLGQRVSTLVNQHMQAGWYEIPFNGSDLSSGVYFYRLNANSFTSIHKMMLLK